MTRRCPSFQAEDTRLTSPSVPANREHLGAKAMLLELVSSEMRFLMRIEPLRLSRLLNRLRGGLRRGGLRSR